MAPHKKAEPPCKEEPGIDCTPGDCTRACGACLSLLLSFTAIASLGVIAAASFWTAESMWRLVNNDDMLQATLCGNTLAAAKYGVTLEACS